MVPWVNIHTHGVAAAAASTVSILNRTQNELGDALSATPFFSAGLHPWYLNDARNEDDWTLLKALAQHDRLAALGECGLDTLRGPHLDIQADWLRRQLVLAEQNRLPVVIHCVRAHGELVALVKKMRLTVPLVVHGFNQKEAILTEFLKNNFYISVGAAILRGDSNAAKNLPKIPQERLFLETDDKPVAIEAVYDAAARILDTPLEALKTTIFQNYTRVFSKNHVEM